MTRILLKRIGRTLFAGLLVGGAGALFHQVWPTPAPARPFQVPMGHILRGMVPDALALHGHERRRIAGQVKAGHSPWPPSPLKTVGTRIADEGVFMATSSRSARAWIRLPGPRAPLGQIAAWPSKDVALVAGPDAGEDATVLARFALQSPEAKHTLNPSGGAPIAFCTRTNGIVLALDAPDASIATIEAWLQALDCAKQWTQARRGEGPAIHWGAAAAPAEGMSVLRVRAAGSAP